MAYYPTYQPYPYQDQLSQLRTANPIANQMPVQGFQMPMNRPDPTGLKEILKQLDVSPEECLYVGDTATDMKTGKSAGAYTVGVLWGFRSEQELRENHADVIISRPEEILEIIDKQA